MVELGYALSSEEHRPNDLVDYARRAEDVGFQFSLISDHYLPWTETQGNSPFVWSVIGGISQVTKNLRLGTGVTCPLIRYHPALIAQAAATSAAMMPGRFFLGLGAGEALNEHILGDHWPTIGLRHDMLVEAIEIIREMWKGDEVTYYGDFYTVEKARLFTLPDPLPPIYLASSGENSAEMAAELADGIISTTPDADLVQAFEKNGGKGKTKIGQVKVVYARSDGDALDTLYKWWPVSALPGNLHSLLPTPDDFEAAAKLVKKDDLASLMPLGPDPVRHIDQIQKMIDAGFNQVYIHQIGPDQEGFFNFYEKEILPHFRS